MLNNREKELKTYNGSQMPSQSDLQYQLSNTWRWLRKNQPPCLLAGETINIAFTFDIEPRSTVDFETDLVIATTINVISCSC